MIEMIVVLVLAALILGITVPHFRGFFSARELQNAVTFLENAVEEVYSRARSEQNIVGIEFMTGKILVFTCEYEDDITLGCKAGTRIDEELLWEGRSVGTSLKITLDPPFTIYMTPPHGDIIDPIGSTYTGGKKELTVTHDKSRDSETLIFYKLSGLLEKQ